MAKAEGATPAAGVFLEIPLREYATEGDVSLAPRLSFHRTQK